MALLVFVIAPVVGMTIHLHVLITEHVCAIIFTRGHWRPSLVLPPFHIEEKGCGDTVTHELVTEECN